MSDRERAVHAVFRNMDGVELWLGGGKLFHWSPGGRSDAEMRAIESTLRTLMCEGHLVTTLPPAPPPVLEVTEEADRAFRDGFDSKTSDGGSWIDSPREAMPRAAGYRAAFPHLLRSCADGLTDEECREISGDVELWGDYGIIRTILRRVAARREA